MQKGVQTLSYIQGALDLGGTDFKDAAGSGPFAIKPADHNSSDAPSLPCHHSDGAPCRGLQVLQFMRRRRRRG